MKPERKLRTGIVRFFLFSLLLSAAAGACAGGPLAWDDCVREMIANSPQLKAAEDSLEKVGSEVKSKYSPFLPQLSAYGDLGASGTDSGDGYSDSSSVGLGLSLKQTLFAGFKNQAELNRSLAMLTSAEMNLKRTKSDLTYTLRSDFAQMLYSQEFLRLAGAIAKRRQDNLSLVELRFEAGREHKGSLLRSRAFAREADLEVEQASRSLSVARRQLLTAMGLQIEMPDMELASDWHIREPGQPPSFPDLIVQTPEHIIGESSLEAAREMLRKAKSDYYPSVTASASAGRQGEAWTPDKGRWSVGLTVSLPLFSGGTHYYGVQSARSELSIAESSLLDLNNQLAALIEQRFAAWQDASDRLRVQADFLEAAELRAEIARSQYSNGLISFQDWDTIENDLINQERAMLASRRDAVIAEASWQRAIGTGAIP